ncbi:hypothetical protein NP233_g1116 [Leucocoprinus birnbaumii]|uniref:Uncharacterized protein n=1 Tax=Leucocoprinus birnbaumii TaxID=56174 RepID=A0AAD5YY76_9AGAR|nr:hypothetical protein NP233_g1116 [Leucocoprinus birnbaumii]
MTKGFLAVLSEPDWYNNEHVPLRLNHISAFLTGARFEAGDGEKPSWIAFYDIASTSTFNDPSYTRLRENRSPREAALVKRLDVLDRRTCEVVFETVNAGAESSSSGFATENPTQWVVTYGLDITEGEELGDMDILTEAWKAITDVGETATSLIRSRLLLCIDSLKSGVAIPSDPEAQKIPKYFVVHGEALYRKSFEIRLSPTEFNSGAGAESFKIVLKGLSNAGNTFEISEERVWKLYRAYPCIAQGNLS